MGGIATINDVLEFIMAGATDIAICFLQDLFA